MSEKIRMRVSALTMDPFTNMPIVILKDLSDQIAVPIWIGLIEASSIATELEETEVQRPMPHDLIKSLIDHLGAVLDRAEIVDLSDQTFYARLHLQTPKGNLVLDCRPSDAIALALRTQASLYVDRTVIEKTRSIESELPDLEQSKTEKWTEILENLTSTDFGKYKM